MGSEGGESLDTIVARKEAERIASDGTFLWGIGNPLGTAPIYAASVQEKVPVLFSRMLSPPKAIDANPAVVFRWHAYVDHVGNYRQLPEHTVVTSRGTTPGGNTKSRHYALVCHSNRPLELGNFGRFDPSAYRNLSAGGEVGPSQVTSMLERVSNEDSNNGRYEVAMVATLHSPYFVRLVDPEPLIYEDRDSLLRRTA